VRVHQRAQAAAQLGDVLRRGLAQQVQRARRRAVVPRLQYSAKPSVFRVLPRREANVCWPPAGLYGVVGTGLLWDVSTLCVVVPPAGLYGVVGTRFVVGCQYTVCCSTSSWTVWGGGRWFVVGCQYTVCCSTSCWTIWGGGHHVCCGMSVHCVL
jgi:hypothetical protein